MHAVSIPPFERFYEEHRAEVMRLLRRNLGRERADDAFQETFLRALQAYGRLDHGEHLRAWVLTIARNVAIDTRPPHEADGGARSRPAARTALAAYEELAPLTDGLPPKERAAVVLRYGYDLSYEQIARALGSSADAARQATSTGVRSAYERGGSRHDHLQRPRPPVQGGGGRPRPRRRRVRRRRLADRRRSSSRSSTKGLAQLSFHPRGAGSRAARRVRRPPGSPLDAERRRRSPRARRVLRTPPASIRPHPRLPRTASVHRLGARSAVEGALRRDDDLQDARRARRSPAGRLGPSAPS